MPSNNISRVLYWIKNHSAMNVVTCNGYTDYLLNKGTDEWKIYIRYITKNKYAITITRYWEDDNAK